VVRGCHPGELLLKKRFDANKLLKGKA
jgi:hypothetical protein